MLGLALALLLQAPAQPSQPTPPIELPVSIDRIREGLARRPIFEPPPPRAWRNVFRVHIDAWLPFDKSAWAEHTMTPPWMRPLAPPTHFQFLESVVPDEVRGATLHPCCNVSPVIGAVSGAIRNTIRSVKENRAKREVQEAMKAAGIIR